MVENDFSAGKQDIDLIDYIYIGTFFDILPIYLHRCLTLGNVLD